MSSPHYTLHREPARQAKRRLSEPRRRPRPRLLTCFGTWRLIGEDTLDGFACNVSLRSLIGRERAGGGGIGPLAEPAAGVAAVGFWGVLMLCGRCRGVGWRAGTTARFLRWTEGRFKANSGRDTR